MSISYSVLDRSMPDVLELLKTSGEFTVEDFPINLSCLDAVHSTDYSHISQEENALVRHSEHFLSTLALDMVVRLLRVLGQPEDALDFHYSSEKNALSDITNKCHHSIISLYLHSTSCSSFTVRVGSLLQTLSSSHNCAGPKSGSAAIEYHLSARASQTYLKLYSLIFHPAKHVQAHDIFSGKKIAGLPDNLSFLCRLMAEIDSIIMYHMATSFQDSIEFSLLFERIGKTGSKMRVSMEHIHQINHILKDTYSTTLNLSRGKFCNFIGSRALPSKAESRKILFEAACRQFVKCDPLAVLPASDQDDFSENNPNGMAPNGSKRKAASRKSQLKKQPIISFAITKNKAGSVLERIQAKEKANKIKCIQQANELDLSYNRFISSLLPGICKALLVLAPSSNLARSFSQSQIVTKLSDSLRNHVSPRQLQDALLALSQKAPGFCSVVSIGNVSGIKIHSGWDLNRLLSTVQ